MEQLEQITDETCVNKVRVMRQPFVLDCDLIHRNCLGLNKQCENYKPVRNSGLRYAYLNLYNGKEKK